MSRWPAETVERIAKMRFEKMPYSAIAEELGHIYTRSAIAGMCARNGIEGPTHLEAERAKGQRRKIIEAKQAAQPIKQSPKPAPLYVPPPTPAEELAKAEGGTTPAEAVLKLRRHQCRWPLGESNSSSFAFCCADANVGETYCEHHRLLSFTPIQRRHVRIRPAY